MTQSASYQFDQEHRDPGSELQRLRAQTLLSWPNEARLLAWLGLRDGLSILELGCGPGFVTEQLLHWLPSSPITALDADPEMLALATRYLEPIAAGRVAYVPASVTDTGLPDNSFDFAIARYLFQHLADPLAAARETLRLLKPGGKLVVIDIDAALWGIVEPIYPQLQAIYAKTGQARRGGNRRIGRRLWRILKAAGFHAVELEAFVYHSDDLGLEPFLPQLDPDRLLRALKSDQISLPEYATAHALFRQFQAAPDAYVLMVGLMACGEKGQDL